MGTQQGTWFLKIRTSDTKRGMYRLSARKKERAKIRKATVFWMATLEARRQGIGDLKTLRKRSNREYYMQCLKILPPLYPFLKKLLENVS